MTTKPNANYSCTHKQQSSQKQRAVTWTYQVVVMVCARMASEGQTVVVVLALGHQVEVAEVVVADILVEVAYK